MPRGKPRSTTTADDSTPQVDVNVFNGLADAISSALAEKDARLVGDAMKEATKRKENVAGPQISTKNPQGDKDYPRPPLAYEKAYIPWEARPEDFTFEEIELLNLLQEGEYWVTRNDGSRVLVEVSVDRNVVTNKPEKLWFRSGDAYGRSTRHLMPEFTRVLREMIGEPAAEVMTMRQRNEAVEAGKLPVSKGS